MQNATLSGKDSQHQQCANTGRSIHVGCGNEKRNSNEQLAISKGYLHFNMHFDFIKIYIDFLPSLESVAHTERYDTHPRCQDEQDNT